MRKLRRFAGAGVWVCAAVALVVGCCSAATAAAAAPSAATGTTASVVRPTTRLGALKYGYHVTARFRGAQCIAGGSEAVTNADRCFVGNLVIDPCWPSVNHRGSYGGDVCLTAPWRHGVVHLRGKNPHNGGGGGRTLWAARLRDGVRCLFAQGATSTYHHRRLNFYCGRHNWLVGHPNRTHRIWTIREVTSTRTGFRHPRTARIDHAWFGRGPA